MYKTVYTKQGCPKIVMSYVFIEYMHKDCVFEILYAYLKTSKQC